MSGLGFGAVSPASKKFSLVFAFPVTILHHRPISRHRDRCDRVIQDESGDSNGGDV